MDNILKYCIVFTTIRAMNAMDKTIAGAFLERAQYASPKGSLSQAKGQRSNTNFHHESYTTRMELNFFKLNTLKWYLLF